jgi:hypothetical protein
MTMMTKTDEAKLAADIVSVLAPAALRACPQEPDVIRYAVRGETLKLRMIILARKALRRLLEGTDGAVKIEYLKRDLLRAARHRLEYRYPRLNVTNRRQSGDFSIETMVKSQSA